jgi:hypothetical protein
MEVERPNKILIEDFKSLAGCGRGLEDNIKV